MAVYLEPDDAESYRMLRIIHWNPANYLRLRGQDPNGEYALAEEAFRKTLKLAPRLAGAYNGLAITLDNIANKMSFGVLIPSPAIERL